MLFCVLCSYKHTHKTGFALVATPCGYQQTCPNASPRVRNVAPRECSSAKWCPHWSICWPNKEVKIGKGSRTWSLSLGVWWSVSVLAVVQKRDTMQVNMSTCNMSSNRRAKLIILIRKIIFDFGWSDRCLLAKQEWGWNKQKQRPLHK